jgi:hypothetical protein
MPRALLAVNLALKPPVVTDLSQARAFMVPASPALLLLCPLGNILPSGAPG